jgi:hypothetical protein
VLTHDMTQDTASTPERANTPMEAGSRPQPAVVIHTHGVHIEIEKIPRLPRWLRRTAVVLAVAVAGLLGFHFGR